MLTKALEAMPAPSSDKNRKEMMFFLQFQSMAWAPNRPTSCDWRSSRGSSAWAGRPLSPSLPKLSSTKLSTAPWRWGWLDSLRTRSCAGLKGELKCLVISPFQKIFLIHANVVGTRQPFTSYLAAGVEELINSHSASQLTLYLVKQLAHQKI